MNAFNFSELGFAPPNVHILPSAPPHILTRSRSLLHVLPPSVHHTHHLLHGSGSLSIAVLAIVYRAAARRAVLPRTCITAAVVTPRTLHTSRTVPTLWNKLAQLLTPSQPSLGTAERTSDMSEAESKRLVEKALSPIPPPPAPYQLDASAGPLVWIDCEYVPNATPKPFPSSYPRLYSHSRYTTQTLDAAHCIRARFADITSALMLPTGQDDRIGH